MTIYGAGSLRPCDPGAAGPYAGRPLAKREACHPGILRQGLRDASASGDYPQRMFSNHTIRFTAESIAVELRRFAPRMPVPRWWCVVGAGIQPRCAFCRRRCRSAGYRSRRTWATTAMPRRRWPLPCWQTRRSSASATMPLPPPRRGHGTDQPVILSGQYLCDTAACCFQQAVCRFGIHTAQKHDNGCFWMIAAPLQSIDGLFLRAVQCAAYDGDGPRTSFSY